MENLTKLFKLLELTRSQPQYGYALAGIPQEQLSNLAEHHYLVAVIAWQITRAAMAEGINLDLAKVMELALVHDLGELFGGDISMPYGRVNPKARKLAKAFEAENQKFLAKFFGKKEQVHFKKLAAEIMDTKTDEGYVVKVADVVEAAHYRSYMNKADKNDLKFNKEVLEAKVKKLKNKQLKQFLALFVEKWSKDFLEQRSSSNVVVDLG